MVITLRKFIVFSFVKKGKHLFVSLKFAVLELKQLLLYDPILFNMINFSGILIVASGW